MLDGYGENQLRYSSIITIIPNIVEGASAERSHYPTVYTIIPQLYIRIILCWLPTCVITS